MKISETIKSLQSYLGEVGDVEVVRMTAVDGRFCIEYDCIFDIVGLPDDDEEKTFDNWAVAFIDPSTAKPDDDDGPRLRVIK